MSLNKVMLIGNLGQDPEVRYLDNQKVVATFTLATSERYTDRNGEKVTETEWHRIETWDSLAKIVEKYCKKGKQIYVEGRIKTETWKDKEGVEKTGKKIRATSITLLGETPKNVDAGHNQSPQNTNPVTQPIQTPVQETDNQSDDLPF
jgi:single-strand DNA-binding protein